MIFFITTIEAWNWIIETWKWIMAIWNRTAVEAWNWQPSNVRCFPFPDDDFCKLGPARSGEAAGTYLGRWDKTAVQKMWPHLLELHLPGILAATVVHFWLPGFALAAYGLKRFQKKGRRVSFIEEHPLAAIGIVIGAAAEVVVTLGLGLYLSLSG
jgi:hypothetical protein